MGEGWRELRMSDRQIRRLRAHESSPQVKEDVAYGRESRQVLPVSKEEIKDPLVKEAGRYISAYYK